MAASIRFTFAEVESHTCRTESRERSSFFSKAKWAEGAIDPQTGKVYKYKKCGLILAPHHRS